MSVTALSPEASPSDDKLVREWKAVRSRLHEAEHRLNSRYAQRKYDGESIDPQEVLRYLAKTYDRAAAMAVKTVTDHDAALGLPQRVEHLFEEIAEVVFTIVP